MDDFARYIRNTNAFSREDVISCQSKRACVVGCGGLGGYVIQILARFGLGHLTLIDGDVFETSNLNRQVFATEETLGQNKAETAQQALRAINSALSVSAHACMLTSDNVDKLIGGHDIVMDCLDSIETRLLLQRACERQNIPMIHGAIGGFFGQITTILPGDNTLDKLYREGNQGVEKTLGNPSFTPPLCASLQAAEAIKLLTGKGDVLRGEVLVFDVLHNDYMVLSL